MLKLNHAYTDTNYYLQFLISFCKNISVENRNQLN